MFVTGSGKGMCTSAFLVPLLAICSSLFYLLFLLRLFFGYEDGSNMFFLDIG
jgi:hypothetical protein